MEVASNAREDLLPGRKWIASEVTSGTGSWNGGIDMDRDSESGISTCSSASSMDDCGIPASYREDPGRRFRILSYNILTDVCIHPGEYLYCPEDIRYMSTRHPRIVAEIESMKPDVVCLQEVDYDNYESRLKGAMKKMGYGEGVFHQRSDDQGLATFWKDGIFQLIKQKHCTVHHLAETCIQMAKLKPDQRKILKEAIDRPEAVLLVRLRHLATGCSLAVGNLHVAWCQLRYPALQSLQVALATNELTDFARGFHCAQILCGDFNSPPRSDAYRMMTTGSLNLDWAMTSHKLNSSRATNSEEDALRIFGLYEVLPPETFNLKINMKSAYRATLGSEPAITSADNAGQNGLTSFLYKLCLDYIFYSPMSLEVVGVLDTPPAESITKHYALPSYDYPSDHLPILAEFMLK